MAKQTMNAAQKKQERQWQIDSALQTLQRAEQIRNDRPLMKEVQKAATNLTKAVGVSKPPVKKRK
jgi:hypothetical protein